MHGCPDDMEDRLFLARCYVAGGEHQRAHHILTSAPRPLVRRSLHACLLAARCLVGGRAQSSSWRRWQPG